MLKFGLLTAICDKMTFKEVVDFAKENKFECLEVACWPKAKAVRRYAGVTHIDVTNLNKNKANKIVDLCKSKGITISALAYYPNPLDPDKKKAQAAINHLYKLMDASKLIGCNLVTTFIGRDPHKTVEENLVLVKKVWTPILKYAEKIGVKVAIENCPMLFTKDEWPGGQNLMTSPNNWRRIFKTLNSPALGINYDPSHFVWQHIDYIKPLKEFKNKIFHVHFKDIKIYRDKLNEVGVMAYPLEYMSPKIPGLGDINWGKFISALTDIGYNGYSVIEIEDKAYENSLEDTKKAIIQTARYLSNYLN